MKQCASFYDDQLSQILISFWTKSICEYLIFLSGENTAIIWIKNNTGPQLSELSMVSIRSSQYCLHRFLCSTTSSCTRLPFCWWICCGDLGFSRGLHFKSMWFDKLLTYLHGTRGGSRAVVTSKMECFVTMVIITKRSIWGSIWSFDSLAWLSSNLL